jgi:hypothetical protein
MRFSPQSDLHSGSNDVQKNISVRVIILAEGISVRLLTRTARISARVTMVLPQLVVFFPIERACMKLDVFSGSDEVPEANVLVNLLNVLVNLGLIKYNE